MPYKAKLAALIGKGYFPKELPPVFTTVSFGTQVADVLEEWKRDGVFSVKTGMKIDKKVASGAYNYKVDPADLEIISIPKRGYERRNLHITHPIPQALLSLELSTHWPTIKKWLLRQRYSIDDIDISKEYSRAIKGINFQVHNAKKGYLEATSDWVVKTDISRFYPTIYTHSISWAAYGKERVKGNLAAFRGSLADRIDALVRACNRNQTVGIPIGPETSRIIAEIISSRIDADFNERMPKVVAEKVDRLQDDWFIGAGSLEQAESILASLISVYRAYGLEINGSKTAIGHIFKYSGSAAISEVNAFLSSRRGRIRSVRLRELCAMALRLQSEFPSEPVVSYVLSIIERNEVGRSDVSVVESFLLKSAVVSPVSMEQICRIILSIQDQTKSISKGRIQERFTRLAETQLENGNIYEALWLIYTLRGLKVKSDFRRIAKIMADVPSSALALVLLDMEEKNLLVGKLPKSKWEGLFSRDRIRSDWVWLLAYEGIRNGWLKDAQGVMGDAFFSAMNSRDVQFYNKKRNMQTSKAHAQQKSVARRANERFMKRFLLDLRGFDTLGY